MVRILAPAAIMMLLSACGSFLAYRYSVYAYNGQEYLLIDNEDEGYRNFVRKLPDGTWTFTDVDGRRMEFDVQGEQILKGGTLVRQMNKSDIVYAEPPPPLLPPGEGVRLPRTSLPSGQGVRRNDIADSFQDGGPSGD